jgi:hypothetical protein
MMTVQTRELEALQAKIRETEERLRNQAAQVSSSTASYGRASLKREDCGFGDIDDTDEEEENCQDQSSPSSSVSSRRPSGEGFTESSSSDDLDEASSEGEHETKSQARKS